MEEDLLGAFDLGFEPIDAIPSSNDVDGFANEEDIESLLSSLAPPSATNQEEPSSSPLLSEREEFDLDLVDYVLNDLASSPLSPTSIDDECAASVSPVSDNNTSSPSPSSSDDSSCQEQQQSRHDSTLVDHNYFSTCRQVRIVVSKPPSETGATVPFKLAMPFTGLPGADKTRPAVRLLAKSPVQSLRIVEAEVGDAPAKRKKLDVGEGSAAKFPRLLLSPEEKQMCEKDGITLPLHYPLTRQEEASLRKIKRKIRNKVSAQSSRRKKKDYLDDIETRATESETENKKLRERVSLLESQNKTLMGLLKRMQSVIVATKEGVQNASPQTSATTLMVLLLSVALFAVPGFKEQYDGKGPLQSADLTTSFPSNVIAPGRSRSLLQYIGKNMQIDTLNSILDESSLDHIKKEIRGLADADYIKKSSNDSRVVNGRGQILATDVPRHQNI